MEMIQIGSIGVVIRGTIVEDDVVVDISSVTTKQIILKSPDGEVLTKTAIFTTDGVDGKLQYTTIAGDLDTIGTWGAQAYIVFSGGFNGRSSVVRFRVEANL